MEVAVEDGVRKTARQQLQLQLPLSRNWLRHCISHEFASSPSSPCRFHDDTNTITIAITAPTHPHTPIHTHLRYACGSRKVCCI